MVDSTRRWITNFLTCLIVLLFGLLCCIPLAYLVAEQSSVKDDITVDTLAALRVPTTAAPMVTRPKEKPLPLAWNTSTATPPEQRRLVPSVHLQGDECVGPLCRSVASALRSQLSSNVDPCFDFYQYVCGKFRGWSTRVDAEISGLHGEFVALIAVTAPSSNQSAIQKAAAMYQACMSFSSSYEPETIELVRWMTEMNLDFLNTIRLESVDPVEVMVRGSLDFGVEAIISITFDDYKFQPYGHKRNIKLRYSKEQEEWLMARKLKWYWTNVNYYATLFLKYGADRGIDLVFAKKMLAYEERLRQIESSTEPSDEWYGSTISGLGEYTSPYVTGEQWAKFFSTYTEGSYTGSEQLEHYERSTTIIKKLFEDKEVGKVGLRYLVAWSIYRQLAKFTDPYLMRGYKKADEACFLLVKDVMRLAIVSHYFQKLTPPEILQNAKRMATAVRARFSAALRSTSWLSREARGYLMDKLSDKFQIGSPGKRLKPESVEKFYESLPDVPLNRLFSSWIQARRLSVHYRWKDEGTLLYNEEKVTAAYYPDGTVVVPTATVQRPIFYEYGPEALNYGSFGMIVGHELMHGLTPKFWVERQNEEVKKESAKRLICMRRSYRSVESPSDQQDDSSDSLDTENVADLVGARIAYAAFAISHERDRRVKLAGLDKSPEQLFFINMCTLWCNWTTEADGIHALARSRCIVPIRNMPEFSSAFGCAEGTVMNPEEKCTYW